MQTLSIPKHWATMPEWFKTNDWLLQYQHRTAQFATRMIHVSADIAGDMMLKLAGQRPMQATSESLMGHVAVNAAKRQYAELLREAAKFTGDDKTQAMKLVEQFKTEYHGYIPFLEEKVS